MAKLGMLVRSLYCQPEQRTAEVHKKGDVAANMAFGIFGKMCDSCFSPAEHFFAQCFLIFYCHSVDFPTLKQILSEKQSCA